MSEISHKNFAFFWTGNDISIPSYLVKSIRHVYKDTAFIYQLTDLKTPYVEGVNKTIRKNLPKKIMLARLKAYASLESNDLICYLDADSLIIDKFSLPRSDNFNAFLIERDDRLSIINSKIAINYPEFYKMKVYELMPLFFGFIATTNGKSFFKNLLEIANTLPPRYHEWFGDQVALKLAWEKNKNNYLLLEQKKFLWIATKILNAEDIRQLKNSDTKIVTFKGPESKELIYQSLISLINVQSTE